MDEILLLYGIIGSSRGVYAMTGARACVRVRATLTHLGRPRTDTTTTTIAMIAIQRESIRK